MARAVVDPEDLRRFAVALKNFNAELQTQTAGIHQQFTKLSETWRDQEQAKFADEFEQMVRALTKFVEASEKQVPTLLHKAAAIQQYLGQR